MSDAELTALVPILGIWLITMVILALVPDWAMATFLHRQPHWITIPLALAIAYASAYFSTAVCRKLWPDLLTEAEANYSNRQRRAGK
jgi:hypothetical protein